MSHSVFALSTISHDMYLSGNGIGILRDSDAVLQTVKTRLLLHYEEWFLDLSEGMPWFTEVMVHNPDFTLIESRVSETVLNTDGVVSRESISLAFSTTNRSLTIDFRYIDVYGNTITESQLVNI